MKKFRTQLAKIDTNVFKELEDVLKRNGIDKVSIHGIHLNSVAKLTDEECPPGYKKSCKVLANGTISCRCRKI